MSAAAPLHTLAAKPVSRSTHAGALLQRSCACGSATAPLSRECPDCNRKKRLQTRLAIGASNDPLEQEADRVADQVLAAPANATVRGAPMRIQRLTRPAIEGTDCAPASVDRVLASPGSPLAPALQQDMGRRFGYDFSQVRVHAGDAAAASARDVNARAYAIGQNIVFGADRYSPGTHEGRRLIAHELTHVVQQSGSDWNRSSKVQRQVAAAAAPAAAAATGGLTEEMLKQIARTLRGAMQGWGTDEEAIYSAFAGRTQEQVDAISRVYQEMYSADLLADLRDELTDSEMAHLAIFSPTAAPGEVGSVKQATAFADQIAQQLNNAMDRLGTDEDSIYSALTGRTEAERQAIKEAYKRLTKRELEADIRDEMSGSELTRALALLKEGVLLPEDEAYLAMKGLGTDEDTLLRVLEAVKGDRAKAEDLIDKFAAKGYGNLLERVNEELSGSDLDKALEALHGQTPSAACSASQRKDALEAISLAAAMAQAANARANTDLVSNKLSFAVKEALSKYFNPGNAPNAVNLVLLRQVRDALDQIRTDILSFSNVVCVTTNDGHCVPKPDCSNFVGAHTDIVGGSTVNICPAFFICDNDQATNMLHEFFHHMGIRDRKIYYGQAGYSSITPIGDGSVNDSLSKADAYAHFAKELF